MSNFISNHDAAAQHLQQGDNEHPVFSNEPLAAGASNISPEIDSATMFEPTMALPNTDIKHQNSTTEAPGTIQDVDVTSDVSSHCDSILIDTSAKVILQGRLTDLNNLIRGEDGQAIPQDLEKLIVTVLSEIYSWLNQGALMEFEAQMALSNIAYNGPTKDNTPNQSSCKDENSLLAGYLSLLRSATGNSSLTDEKRRILQTLLRESEEFVNEPERARTLNSHRDELNLLHIICDSDIAIHSVELAIQLISRGNIASQSRAQAQRGPALQRQEIERLKGIHRPGGAVDLTRGIERLLEAVASAPLESANRPALLNDLGMLYQSRFDLLEEVADLDAAVERKFEAVASTPLDSADRPGFLNNLGSSYRCRFERLGERKDIDSAIERQLEAVTSTPLNSTDRPRRLNNLGNSYQSRFERLGEADDLDLAIERQVEAVDSTPVDSPDQPILLNNLGNSYIRRFKRFGEVKDIDSAIEQQLKAVASTAVDSAYRAVFLTNLGISYESRFKRFGDVKDLDSAIERQSEAVASTPLHNPNRPVLLGNLGNSYHSRFERFGDVNDITLAIERNLEAVASTPLDSADRPRRLNNLGNSYIRCFERLGKRKDLDSAIERQVEAVASTPPNSPHRPEFLNNLGFSYKSRFEWFGDVKDIDSAIERAREAVVSTPLDNAERLTLLTNLGDSYRCRFERFGEVKDIDLAIKQTIEAVIPTPLDSANRPGRLNNLGISYIRRFLRFGEAKDGDLAIEQQVEAVASTPVDSPLRPVLLSNLGISYQSRFERFGKADDLDLAIKKNLEAVAFPQLDSADRPRRLNNLGNSYIRRFERFGEVEDIDSAIKHQAEAIASTPPGSTARPGYLNNLGISYQSRFKRFREVKDINLAIEQKLEAVASTSLDSADRPAQLNSLGSSYMHRFESLGERTDFANSIHNFRLSSLSRNGLPSLRIGGSLQWAHFTHQVNDLRSASEAYDQAIRLLPQVAWIGLNAVAQLNELNSGIQTLGCDAAACMIALAQAEPHHEQRHLGHAIELLDQGRSILWSQTSNFRRDLEDLKKVDSQLASDLDLEGKTLGQGCFRDLNDTFSETDAQAYRRSAEKWEELVHRIRELPGFQHFLLPSPISTLQTAAADGPVVIINPSQYRCDALIIPPQGNLTLVPLPDTAVAELKILTNQQEEFASRKSKSVWIPSNYPTPSTTLEQVLNRTWLLVGEPILQKFKELRLVTVGSEAPSKMHVWWCLTGSFSFLPIHASFPPTQPAIGMMDIVVSSYTPTISALLRARNRNKRPTFRMLAVGQSKVSGMTQLPGVTEEIAFISHTLGAEAKTLQEYNATVDAVAASLPTCSWAHFACHGVQDPHKPMDSGLVMWNAHRLTLSRIAQSSLTSAEFAFLSSCQSATGSQQFPNEAVHLAAGLQFIGFRGVIGTMWSVGDNDALNVAKEVYKELFKNGTDNASPSEAALALHKAIHHLRDHVPLVRWVPFVHFGL